MAHQNPSPSTVPMPIAVTTREFHPTPSPNNNGCCVGRFTRECSSTHEHNFRSMTHSFSINSNGLVCFLQVPTKLSCDVHR